jgi:hypothetical protein
MKDVEKTRRISRRKQYELLKAGKIRAKKDGVRTIIDLESVDAYQSSLRITRRSRRRSDGKQRDRLLARTGPKRKCG